MRWCVKMRWCQRQVEMSALPRSTSYGKEEKPRQNRPAIPLIHGKSPASRSGAVKAADSRRRREALTAGRDAHNAARGEWQLARQKAIGHFYLAE